MTRIRVTKKPASSSTTNPADPSVSGPSSNKRGRSPSPDPNSPEGDDVGSAAPAAKRNKRRAKGTQRAVHCAECFHKARPCYNLAPLPGETEEEMEKPYLRRNGTMKAPSCFDCYSLNARCEPLRAIQAQAYADWAHNEYPNDAVTCNDLRIELPTLAKPLSACAHVRRARGLDAHVASTWHQPGINPAPTGHT